MMSDLIHIEDERASRAAGSSTDGITVRATIRAGKRPIRDALLFTHLLWSFPADVIAFAAIGVSKKLRPRWSRLSQKNTHGGYQGLAALDDNMKLNVSTLVDKADGQFAWYCALIDRSRKSEAEHKIAAGLSPDTASDSLAGVARYTFQSTIAAKWWTENRIYTEIRIYDEKLMDPIVAELRELYSSWS
jgi:hypothetical protein